MVLGLTAFALWLSLSSSCILAFSPTLIHSHQFINIYHSFLPSHHMANVLTDAEPVLSTRQCFFHFARMAEQDGEVDHPTPREDWIKGPRVSTTPEARIYPGANHTSTLLSSQSSASLRSCARPEKHRS
jgi:hypothetical protein